MVDRCIQAVYLDWVPADYGLPLTEGVGYDRQWQAWCRDLMVLPSRSYDTPGGKSCRRFIYVLAVELAGFRERHWEDERFVVFQTVILQRALHVSGSQATLQRLLHWLEACEESHHCMLFEDTLHLCEQFLSTSRQEDTEEKRARKYTSLVQQGNLCPVVWWITDRGGGYQPRYICFNTGCTVLKVLQSKHIKAHPDT